MRNLRTLTSCQMLNFAIYKNTDHKPFKGPFALDSRSFRFGLYLVMLNFTVYNKTDRKIAGALANS